MSLLGVWLVCHNGVWCWTRSYAKPESEWRIQTQCGVEILGHRGLGAYPTEGIPDNPTCPYCLGTVFYDPEEAPKRPALPFISGGVTTPACSPVAHKEEVL